MGSFSNPKTFFNGTATGKLYNSLVILAYLTKAITNDGAWAKNLVDLMTQHSHIPQADMGFIPGWDQLAIWRQ